MVNDTKQRILDLLKQSDMGLSTSDLCKECGFERHTMAKYLATLKAEQLIQFRTVGRTKLWTLNKAPIMTLLNDEHQLSQSFKELLNNLDEKIYLVSKEKEIVWANNKVKDTAKKCFENFRETGACQNCPADLSLMSGEKEVHHRSFEGKELKVSAVPIKDIHGEPVAFLEIVREQ